MSENCPEGLTKYTKVGSLVLGVWSYTWHHGGIAWNIPFLLVYYTTAKIMTFCIADANKYNICHAATVLHIRYNGLSDSQALETYLVT